MPTCPRCHQPLAPQDDYTIHELGSDVLVCERCWKMHTDFLRKLRAARAWGEEMAREATAKLQQKFHQPEEEENDDP